MQANQAPVMWIVAIATILLFGAGFFAVSGINNNLKLVADGLNDIDVPTAAEISASIVIPEIVIPEMPEVDTEKLDELWEGVYFGQIESLEDLAKGVSNVEFLKDNVEYLIKGEDINENSEIFELLEDEYDDVNRIKVISDVEDWEVEVINLGLADKDEVSGNDREVELSANIRFKVYFDNDDNDWDKISVDINSVVTSDDGDLEAEITYSL